MKSLSFLFDNIFKGLYAGERFSLFKPELEECHNLEPVDGDYKIFGLVTDLDAEDIEWGGSGETAYDVWKDEGSDVWVDDDSDVFIDD